MIATIVVSFFIIACFHAKSNIETFVHFIKLDHEHFILNSKELMRYYTSGTARVIYAVSIGVSTVGGQAPELIQKEISTSVILRKAAKGTMVD